MKKGKGKNSGLLPSSLKIISSCLKTVSTNASTVFRSAGASVAASISSSRDDRTDQVTWAGFDKLELGPTIFRQVLLLGYQNGFQVYDVEDASNFFELVSRRDGPVTFLQMLPFPAKLDSNEGFRSSHPLLVVVAGDEPNNMSQGQTGGHLGSLGRDGLLDPQSENSVNSPMAVRFYSMRSNCFVQVLKFRSAVCMVRCSSRIVAVGLATQIYCIDALTLENKFSVLTYPVPQFGGQGAAGVNFGYGPMAVGPRWLAYASDNPLVSNTGRLSPKNLSPSAGISPPTSPGSGSLMARYAIESSKQLASGIINLGDIGYKTLSKFHSDLLPDAPSSPVGSSSGWKVGRLAASEMENAGMVVVKDFISRIVISQFRAHTSPISALCFDPSGTLLVTASVNGKNVNIFRIMPSGTHNGSGTSTRDWSYAHVHLYKLHRGITTAIIQDICFSHYSQWVAIISNKGTCHVYVLSPFGGEAGFQTFTSNGGESSLYLVSSQPWWSSSSFIKSQHSSPPPLPVSLYVVSRIRDGNSGLLNSVTMAASSAAGKVSVPSGAVAAVFHNSMLRDSGNVQSMPNSLEHLLVYTPSSHVVQYSILSLISIELSDNGLRTRSGSHMHTQDDELRVKVEPFQWWDVRRKSDWQEREESISGATFAGQEVKEFVGDNYKANTVETNKVVSTRHTMRSDSVNPQERFHGFLANAEVQIDSGGLPIWQRSKIRFYTMNPPGIKSYVGGEIEVEQINIQEVEIKWKDLLPVFDHFHGIKSTWNDRGLIGGVYPNSSPLGLHQVRDKVTEETVICHSNPASLSSTESSDGGSSRRIENLLDLDQMNAERPVIANSDIWNILNQDRRGTVNAESSLPKQKSLAIVFFHSEHPKESDSHTDAYFINQLCPTNSNILSSGRAIIEANLTFDTGNIRDEQDLTVDHFDLVTKISTEGSTPSRQQNFVDIEPFFQEGYCKALGLDGCHHLTGDVTEDVEPKEEHSKREVFGGDRESDELLGGSFSEEG